jgi:hypothetical protein
MPQKGTKSIKAEPQKAHKAQKRRRQNQDKE